jgi:hypothetical protein
VISDGTSVQRREEFLIFPDGTSAQEREENVISDGISVQTEEFLIFVKTFLDSTSVQEREDNNSCKKKV